MEEGLVLRLVIKDRLLREADAAIKEVKRQAARRNLNKWKRALAVVNHVDDKFLNNGIVATVGTYHFGGGDWWYWTMEIGGSS